MQPARLEQHRVKEHREGTEQHHAAHRHCALMRLGLQRRLEREHGRRAADRAARRRQQRRVAVELHDFHPGPRADHQRAHDDQHRLSETGQADLGDFLQADAQPEKCHGNAQELACREVDAGRPAFGHAVTQRIAVNGAGHDTDDQRAQTQASDGRDRSDAGHGRGEQCNEQNAVELAAGG